MKNLMNMKTVNIITKKEFLLTLILGLFTTFIQTSCNKDENPTTSTTLADEVAGTYSGTLKNSATNESKPATLTVTRVNDSLVSMHCVAVDFDTTMMNLCYQNGDQIMPCYTGQDFFNQYGHNLDNYNFCNSKQSGWSSGWCNNNNCWSGEDNWNAWTNHLNTQHSQTDKHYGHFNMNGRSCEYTFNIKTPTATYTQQFVGAIQ